MKPPCTPGELKDILSRVLAENREHGFTGDLLLDVIFSGGLAGSTMKQAPNGAHLYVAVQEMVPPPPEAYEKGVALASFPHQRVCPDVKLLHYIGAVLAHQTVVPRLEAFEVLFVSPGDEQTILEGSTFTMFFVDPSGEVVTPPLDGKILDSITRRVLMEILRGSNVHHVREDTVFLRDLASWPEAFLVSTTRDILPVTRVDRTIIGDGTPGPVTLKLMKLFQDYITGY